MRRILGWVLGLSILLLAACGGGGGNAGTCALCGGSGSSSGGTTGTTGPTVADLRVDLSALTMANQLPQPITVTVTAVNASNQIVSGAPVVVTASNGGVVTSTGSSTDSTGTLTSTVGMGADSTPRTITVTATSGSIVKTATFSVVAGASGGSATMNISLSSQTVTANAPVTVSVTLLDANGAAVPSTVVGFSTVMGLGTFSSTTALTNAQGVAAVALYPVSSTASGADNVRATATVNGTALTKTSGFQITATAVTISSFTSDLAAGSLSAYGQANLTVTLAGTTAGTPVALSVVSQCANKNKASVTPATVTTSTGTATFTYKDAGCGATDAADTITVSVNGTATSKALPISLTSPSVSSLGFVSASPSTIFLKGSGYTETSTVTFVVKDQAGNPLPNQSVAMTPTTTVGGLTMDGGSATVTKLSDANGQVTVRINSGTIPTPVRVTAVLTGTSITTVSSNLSVAVGLPSQLNFSLSQKTINIEGMNVDGTSNLYTVIASDRMGNPVPDGTTINFIAEGGQIQSQNFTLMANGLTSATAQFQSAAPRPDDGRVTVVAYAQGEESFLDADGNNCFTGSPGCPSTGVVEDYQDLGNVFVSRYFSATYNPNQSDQYIGTLVTGSCHTPTSNLLALNASIPSVAGSCDGTWGKAYVRRAVETVFSTSDSRLLWFRLPGGGVQSTGSGQLDSVGCSPFTIVTSNDGWASSQTTYYTVAGSALYNLPAKGGSVALLVADSNPNRLNPMPAGTIVSATATSGISVTVGGGSPVPNTSSASSAAIGIDFGDTTFSGTVYLTTESPGHLKTTHAFGVSRPPIAPLGSACTL